jgi:ribosomal protein S18 acetylase RimI-like enzyme
VIIPITEEYFESFYACLDSVVRERIYLAGIKARPIESTRKFVLNNIENNYPQYIAVEDKQVVGWCDIIPMRGMDFAHSGTLGMGVHRDYRNMGIGSALLDATLEAAKRFGLERVELEVYTSNTIAMRMYEKYGFKLEGIKRKARKLDGKYYDIQVMALFFNQ